MFLDFTCADGNKKVCGGIGIPPQTYTLLTFASDHLLMRGKVATPGDF